MLWSSLVSRGSESSWHHTKIVQDCNSNCLEVVKISPWVSGLQRLSWSLGRAQAGFAILTVALGVTVQMWSPRQAQQADSSMLIELWDTHFGLILVLEEYLLKESQTFVQCNGWIFFFHYTKFLKYCNSKWRPCLKTFRTRAALRYKLKTSLWVTGCGSIYISLPSFLYFFFFSNSEAH